MRRRAWRVRVAWITAGVRRCRFGAFQGSFSGGLAAKANAARLGQWRGGADDLKAAALAVRCTA
jgi:hypothetical protein